jgi:hypothetical protein
MNRNRLLPFAIFQIIPLLIFPPDVLVKGWLGIVALALVFVVLGWGLMQGRGWALMLSILMQGLNVIVRLMMFFPNSVSESGTWNLVFAITSLLAIGISIWLLARLDRQDIRSLIIS